MGKTYFYRSGLDEPYLRVEADFAENLIDTDSEILIEEDFDNENIVYITEMNLEYA